MAPDPSLRNTLPFNASVDIGLDAPSQISKLVSSHPNLKVYTRASPSFQDLKHIWNLNYQKNDPLAMIRATNSSDFSTVVKFCSESDLPLSIRSGGHDLWGRSVVHDAIILDIRELNQITLSEDKKSVTIGGGTQAGALVDLLDKHGLVTPSTLAGDVGHIGWAFMGGFGPFVNTFGLGVDQIISAKIVTADGVERIASNELLWGIKGAGGAFGVLTEVTFKTYSLPKLLGGMLVFKFDEAPTIVEKLQELVGSGTLPNALSLGTYLAKRGGQPMLNISFSWSSGDFEEGQKWLNKIKSLGMVMMDMVSEISIKQWCDQIVPMLPPPSYNNSTSVLTKALTPKAVQDLVAATASIPDDVAWAIAGFYVFGDPIKPHPDSCFQLREPFLFLHMLAPVVVKDRFSEAKQWTENIREVLQKSGLIKANYLAITGPESSVAECFGKKDLVRLKALKKKIDPGNVFKHVPANLVDA